MKKLPPLKRYGQNFLTDKNVINKIIESFSANPDDLIVEIGPGRGALTEILVERCKNFYAVEIDKGAAGILKERFPALNIIHKDFLKFNLSEIAGNRKLRVIGNIPYNITKPIILKLIQNRNIINDAMLMVQLEVAEKITALKNHPDYGIMSVLMRHFTQTEICFKVSPNVFFPKPKVHSAVIKINFKSGEETAHFPDDRIFIQIVNAAFSGRRKTLKNSLHNGIFADCNFDACGIDLSERAEQLEIEDFIKLADCATQQLKSK